MPFGWHTAGIIGSIVDDPAPAFPLSGTAQLIIFVAKYILAHGLSFPQAVPGGADGGTVPPSEYFAQKTHAVRLASAMVIPQIKNAVCAITGTVV